MKLLQFFIFKAQNTVTNNQLYGILDITVKNVEKSSWNFVHNSNDHRFFNFDKNHLCDRTGYTNMKNED